MTRDRYTEAHTPRIHYQDRGCGPTLLVLNGWSGSGLIWPDAWLERLEGSFRLLLVDNRGTGHSERAEAPFTMKDQAKDAVAVLDEAGVDAAYVFGLSMGGMIAQTVAVEFPERVRGLVLCATTAGVALGVPAPPEILVALATPPTGRSRRELLGHAWQLIAAPGFVERHPARFDALVDKLAVKPTEFGVIALQLQAITGFGYQSADLGAIRVPTLVVHGDLDPLIPVENAAILADAIPGARLEIFLGVGHLVADEAPDELATMIEEFLLRLE